MFVFWFDMCLILSFWIPKNSMRNLNLKHASGRNSWTLLMILWIVDWCFRSEAVDTQSYHWKKCKSSQDKMAGLSLYARMCWLSSWLPKSGLSWHYWQKFQNSSALIIIFLFLFLLQLYGEKPKILTLCPMFTN